MYEDQFVSVRVVGVEWLNANVKEPHAVLELLAWPDGLTANGRGCKVACGRVVGAGNG